MIVATASKPRCGTAWRSLLPSIPVKRTTWRLVFGIVLPTRSWHTVLKGPTTRTLRRSDGRSSGGSSSCIDFACSGTASQKRAGKCGGALVSSKERAAAGLCAGLPPIPHHGLPIRRHCRPDQSVRLPVHRAQPGCKLPGPARFPGQSQQQRPADDVVPAREDRGPDRPRVREGHRKADGRNRARRRRDAALASWASTTRTSTARRSSSSARPVRWTSRGAGRSSTGSTPPTCRARRSAISPSGTISRASIEGVPDSFARAYSVMMTEPQGPIYMCYDAWLQEQPLAVPIPLPKATTERVPGAHRPRSRAARGSRRSSRNRQMADVAGRIRRAKRTRLRRSGRARRNGWRCRVRRQYAPQLPERTSAQSQPR